jgi:hypothetical protein
MPIFKISAQNSNRNIRLLGVVRLNHRDILLIRRILDPNAWARKYLTAASVSWNFFELIRIGINLKRFSSIAAHRKIQFLDDRAISVLVIIIDADKIINGDSENNIKIWCINT